MRPLSGSRSNTSIINCNCAEPTTSRNVRKEGSNFGRQFLACAKAQNDSTKCDFFQWCDEPSIGSSNTQSMRPAPSQSSFIEQSQNENSQNASVACSCGISAILRNVKKEGSNFGKQFFACSKSQSDTTRCDFFQWNDGNAGPACISRFEQNAQINVSNKTKCHCNLIALTKSCSKAGPNQGRQFYTCTKSSARCNFFQWIDEDDSSKALQKHHSASFQAYGSSSNSKNGSSTNVTCYKCGQEGHFSTNCNSRSEKKRNSENANRGKRRKKQFGDY